MKDQLKSTVKESIEDIEYKHGQLKMDDDFETFEDGVNIIIYSKQGEPLAEIVQQALIKRYRLNPMKYKLLKTVIKNGLYMIFSIMQAAMSKSGFVE